MAQVENKPNWIEQAARTIASRLASFFAPERLLKNVIKGAAVMLTLPATILVAKELYPGDPILQAMSQFAAAILVEGTMLLGWHKLDNDRTATHAQRWLYAVLAVVAYLVLWAVAIKHGEGPIGIAFRLTLGVLIASSVVESGILASIRLQRAADRNIISHRKVRGYRESAEIRVARLEVDAWERAQFEQIQPGYLPPARINGWTVLAWVLGRQASPVASNTPQLPAPSEPQAEVALTARDRQLLTIWKANPHASDSEVAAIVGVKRQAVQQRRKQLESKHVIHVNGNGVEIVEREQ